MIAKFEELEAKRHKQLLQHVKKRKKSIKQSLRGSLLGTQKPASGACLEANESSPHPADLHRSDPL
jgi:hypothetical protein